jgi:rod shape-determining protein MreC
MRNLISLLWKYHFALLFLFLEILSLSLFLSFNSFQGANFLGFTNEASGRVNESFSNFSSYLSLKETNQELSEENARLREQLKSSYHSLLANRVYFGDTLYEQQYEFISSKIVNSTTNKRNNFVLINKGKRHGIDPDMGIISSKGVLGIVKTVSNNYSLVSSMLHSKIQVSAQLKGSSHFGIVNWPGGDAKTAILYDIPSHVKIKEGNVVETRGSSTYFPKGIEIGKVIEILESDDPAFHEISIKLSHDFSRSGFVYVVKNQLKEEQLEIENSIAIE